MSVFTLSLKGDARGKGRPRATTRRVGKRVVASVYTDGPTKRYEASVKKVAAMAMAPRSPMTGPLSVSLRFRLRVPASATKRQRAAYLSGEEAYLGAYDIDNLAKSILDACNGVVWADDRQITRLFVTKIAAEEPGVDLRVEAYQPQEGEG